MKNFINNIITFSLRNKFFILFMTLLVVNELCKVLHKNLYVKICVM